MCVCVCRYINRMCVLTAMSGCTNTVSITHDEAPLPSSASAVETPGVSYPTTQGLSESASHHRGERIPLGTADLGYPSTAHIAAKQSTKSSKVSLFMLEIIVHILYLRDEPVQSYTGLHHEDMLLKVLAGNFPLQNIDLTLTCI